VKLTDFGLGRQDNSSGHGSIAYSASMNSPSAGQIVGTLEYMSSEQRSGSPVDARADLYSCGVVLFEMLTGQRPAGMELPSDLRAGIPANLDEVFRRSYARLEKRYASAGEFLAAVSKNSFPPPLLLKPPPIVSSCPNCRMPVDGADQFCMYCGVQVVPVVRRCPKCGAYPDAADKYCMFCGQTMGIPMATA
jgi:serine/threonine protein kinase